MWRQHLNGSSQQVPKLFSRIGPGQGGFLIHLPQVGFSLPGSVCLFCEYQVRQVLLLSGCWMPLGGGCIHGIMDKRTRVHVSSDPPDTEGSDQDPARLGQGDLHRSLVASTTLVRSSVTDGVRSLPTPQPSTSSLPPRGQDLPSRPGISSSHGLETGPSIEDVLNQARRPSTLATYA